MKFKKYFHALLFFFLLCNTSEAQKRQIKSVTVELLGNVFANSRKHFQFNTNEHAYYEGRVGYKFSRYFEGSLSVAYQERNYLYFAVFQQPAYQEALLFMRRNYFPVAVNSRLYLTQFFHENLKLLKNEDRWDIYVQISLGTILGNDVPDSREAELQSQGAAVPFYMYPYVQVHNRLQASYVGGVRYNINKNVGFFVEGGEGLLTNAVVGISTHF